MDDKQAQTKQTRLQQATEHLYGDSRLRSALTDEQATRLLAWARSRIQQTVEHTLNLPEDDAAGVIENRTQNVKGVLRQVNQMVTELSDASRAKSREFAMQFVDVLCNVDSRTVHINDIMELEKIVSNRDSLNKDEIFNRLIEIITAAEEEE